jgi:hypothetical protein
MATIERAYYNESGSINVIFEGQSPTTFITVPPDPLNKDYVDLMKWEEAGGIIEPWVPPPPPPPPGPTLEERMASLENQLAQILAKL